MISFNLAVWYLYNSKASLYSLCLIVYALSSSKASGYADVTELWYMPQSSMVCCRRSIDIACKFCKKVDIPVDPRWVSTRLDGDDGRFKLPSVTAGPPAASNRDHKDQGVVIEFVDVGEEANVFHSFLCLFHILLLIR
jgi:hypothetical protein